MRILIFVKGILAKMQVNFIQFYVILPNVP